MGSGTEIRVGTADACRITGISRQHLWSLVAQNRISRPTFHSHKKRGWLLSECLLMAKLRQRQIALRRIEREAA